MLPELKPIASYGFTILSMLTFILLDLYLLVLIERQGSEYEMLKGILRILEKGDVELEPPGASDAVKDQDWADSYYEIVSFINGQKQTQWRRKSWIAKIFDRIARLFPMT